MLSRERYASLLQSFPFLRAADPVLAAECRSTLMRARLPRGRHVFQAGDRATALPLLTAGSVRVYQVGRSGREITLYRFGAGQACLLSASAILGGSRLPVAAVVEERADVALVPAAALRRWVHAHAVWRDFVFQLMSQRLTDVLGLVNAVVFERMDARVAALLVERTTGGGTLRITHQVIAAELGTSREVVSRILESLAAAGLLRVTRGRIEVLDQAGLAASAAA